MQEKINRLSIRMGLRERLQRLPPELRAAGEDDVRRSQDATRAAVRVIGRRMKHFFLDASGLPDPRELAELRLRLRQDAGLGGMPADLA